MKGVPPGMLPVATDTTEKLGPSAPRPELSLTVDEPPFPTVPPRTSWWKIAAVVLVVLGVAAAIAVASGALGAFTKP